MSDQTVEPTQKQEGSSLSESRPIVGLTYWVCCKGFRTRAIYTQSGKWLSPVNGREVDGVIRFFE